MAETLVRARASQMGEVAKVFKASRRDALPYLPELHSAEEDEHYFSDVVFAAAEVFVALRAEDDKILGFIAFTREQVEHLYVLPEAQRAGLGSRLLKLAKERTSSLQLWAFQRNERALRFYTRHGFRVVEQTDGSNNEEQEPDVLLAWSA